MAIKHGGTGIHRFKKKKKKRERVRKRDVDRLTYKVKRKTDIGKVEEQNRTQSLRPERNS